MGIEFNAQQKDAIKGKINNEVISVGNLYLLIKFMNLVVDLELGKPL